MTPFARFATLLLLSGITAMVAGLAWGYGRTVLIGAAGAIAGTICMLAAFADSVMEDL